MSQMSYLCVLSLIQLEKCAQDLGSTSKTVGSSMAQLLTCAAQGNEHYTGSVFYTRVGLRSLSSHLDTYGILPVTFI